MLLLCVDPDFSMLSFSFWLTGVPVRSSFRFFMSETDSFFGFPLQNLFLLDIEFYVASIFFFFQYFKDAASISSCCITPSKKSISFSSIFCNMIFFPLLAAFKILYHSLSTIWLCALVNFLYVSVIKIYWASWKTWQYILSNLENLELLFLKYFFCLLVLSFLLEITFIHILGFLKLSKVHFLQFYFLFFSEYFILEGFCSCVFKFSNSFLPQCQICCQWHTVYLSSSKFYLGLFIILCVSLLK